MRVFNWLILGHMPDQAAGGPGGGGALPGAGYHSGLALMCRGFMLDNLTEHVPAAMQGWAPLVSLLEKRKYLSCPTMTEKLKEKSEKYSLRSREANDHSLNNTGVFLISSAAGEREEGKTVFTLI